MRKSVKRLLYFFLTIIVIFVTLFGVSVFYGGVYFRWIGDNAEEAGEFLKEKSYNLAKQADRLKGIRKVAEDTVSKAGKAIDFVNGTNNKD